MSTPEGLTGFVRGYPASNIEERFARALEKLDIKYWFQYKVPTLFSLPRQARNLDFLVFYSPVHTAPVEIYGLRWHGTAGDRDIDLERQVLIDQYGDTYGWDDLEIVWENELMNQSMADAKARSMFK